MTVYGKDAWLHRKNCPWLEYMDLEKGDRVLFQVEINERGQPAVMRIVKFKKDWGDEDDKFDTSLKMGRVR